MALVYDNTKPASQGGGWIEWPDPLTWPAELERRRAEAKAKLERSKGRWNTVRNVAYGAAAIPFGAAAIGALAGGGGAAGSAATGAATLPPEATAGMLPMSMANGAGASGGAATAAGSAAAREAAKGGIFGGLTAKDWAALGLTGVGTLGSMFSGDDFGGPNTATSDPQLQKLLATMQGRLDKSEPLYDSIMAMANGLLPTEYQKGGGGRG